MLDAEGCMFIHRRKAGQHNGQGYYRQADSFSPGVEICNTSEAVVERIEKLVGKGSICASEAGRHGRKQTLYRWNLRTTESRDFVREVYPHLIAKRKQARLLIGCPSSGEAAVAAHLGLIALHRGSDTGVDFAEPASMFEPGYYLRSDIIWSKPNPMPESVTDRPTKSHEYLFLLAKSERYFYDADAIAEPAIHAGREIIYDGTQKNCSAGDGVNDRRTLISRPITVGDKRNKRSVWTVCPRPYPGAHFAVYPPELIQPCIKAGSRPGDVVLDPFNGSGTTAEVCREYGRRYVGIDLNASYIDLSASRLRQRVLFGAEVA
jgi:hypothetical protein